MESKDERKSAMLVWLKEQCGLDHITLQPMIGNASFRRYFRIALRGASYIVMDAPPPKESCFNFIAIAKALRMLGIKTPEIIFAEPYQGFLLISDFGDSTYLKVLNAQNADKLYQHALQNLLILQNCQQIDGVKLPFFTKAFMWQEWHWHKEWFAHKLLGLDLRSQEKSLDQCFAFIAKSAAEQPRVFMHRDFHSANLMLLPSSETGVLDFQDAFYGPITYDLVSLLRDCYIDWPDEIVTSWALHYYDLLLTHQRLADVDESTFLRWFDFMGLERHLKALFTFARKKRRDGEESYLQYVPRTLNYLWRTSMKYPELAAMTTYIQTQALPAFKGIFACEL